MNAIAIVRTGNEEDIIEPFIRHHLEHFSSLIIYEDNTTDCTSLILEKLIGEGSDIRIIRAAEVSWPPLEVSSRLMHLAFSDMGATWVAPIDVDEFVELPERQRLRDWLPGDLEAPIQLRWNNFIWNRWSLAFAEANPVLQMTSRMPARTDSCKYVIPKTSLNGDSSARLSGGNHSVFRQGEYIGKAAYNSSLSLCHYPIRSVDQFIGKCVLMSVRYSALPNRPLNAGFQYRKPLELIRQGAFEELKALMEHESSVYALQAGGSMEGQIKDAPLMYLGGELRYSHCRTPLLSKIVKLAEATANRSADLERGIIASADKNEPAGN